DAAQPGQREKCLVGKPSSPVLARKVLVDDFYLLENLRARQGHEHRRIAEIAVVFRNFVAQYKVIAEGVVREFGEQPMVLMGVAFAVSQNKRRIEIAFNILETVLYFGTLKGEISVAEPEHLNLFLTNIFKKCGCAVASLGPARPRTT